MFLQLHNTWGLSHSPTFPFFPERLLHKYANLNNAAELYINKPRSFSMYVVIQIPSIMMFMCVCVYLITNFTNKIRFNRIAICRNPTFTTIPLILILERYVNFAMSAEFISFKIKLCFVTIYKILQ